MMALNGTGESGSASTRKASSTCFWWNIVLCGQSVWTQSPLTMDTPSSGPLW
jgi:hypothetical protein